MDVKLEHLALVVVAVVLVVAVVQATQLAGLNDKVSKQNTALAAAAGNSSTANNPAPAPAQQPVTQGSPMVGGC